MKGALIILYSPAKLGTVLTFQAERMEISGIRTRCFSNGLDAEIRQALIEFVTEGVDSIIIPLTFATGLGPSKPTPKEKMKEILENMGLPEDTKIPEQKPLDIPESINVDDRDVPVRVRRSFGPELSMRGVIGSMLNRLDANPFRMIVITVGHGSFDGSSIRAVEFSASFARDIRFQAIAYANEFEEPIVEQALKEALSSGMEDILVILMFMSLSQHSSMEIPEKLGLLEGERARQDRRR